MVRMRFEGGAELAAVLKTMPNRLTRKVIREALVEGGEYIRERASSIAPREPGAPDLAENIVISNARPEEGAVGIAIGPSRGFFYGFFQEFGTVHHSAQPFMRPAFDGETPKALSVIRDAMWDGLVSRGFGLGRSVSSPSSPVTGGPGGGLL